MKPVQALNRKYMVRGPLLVGPVVEIRKIKNGETLGVCPQNIELFLALSKRYRVRGHSDGWFVDGRGHRAQIWEYGPGKLGLTVTGAKLVNSCTRLDWLSKHGIGDQEANFNCPWDDVHLKLLENLVRLQRRKRGRDSDAKNAPNSHPTP